MKLVRQIHEYGCFPAALAMISGRSYNEMLKLIYPKRKKANWNIDGVSDEAIYRSLNRLGIKYRKRKPTTLSNIKSNAILIIGNYLGDTNTDHTVIWDYEKQKILDPYPNKNRSRKKKFPLTTYQNNLLYILEIIG